MAIKCAGYPADAQIRSSWLMSPEQEKHSKELSITLLALVSNLESYQEHIDDATSRSGNIIDGGWVNLVNGEPDALSIRLKKINKSFAMDLLQHLKYEFPELAYIDDWTRLSEYKITDDFITRLKLKANRGDFTGKCDHCPLDDES